MLRESLIEPTGAYQYDKRKEEPKIVQSKPKAILKKMNQSSQNSDIQSVIHWQDDVLKSFKDSQRMCQTSNRSKKQTLQARKNSLTPTRNPNLEALSKPVLKSRRKHSRTSSHAIPNQPLPEVTIVIPLNLQNQDNKLNLVNRKSLTKPASP